MGENKLRFSFDKKDRKNSILIVGVGATNKHYNDIVKPESKKEMIDTTRYSGTIWRSPIPIRIWCRRTISASRPWQMRNDIPHRG